MILLRHNNVDNYPSTWEKFDKTPTVQEIIEIMSQYSFDDIEFKAEELVAYGETSMDDADSATFELEEV